MMIVIIELCKTSHYPLFRAWSGI